MISKSPKLISAGFYLSDLDWISHKKSLTRLLFWAEFQSPPLPRNPGKSSFWCFKSSFCIFRSGFRIFTSRICFFDKFSARKSNLYVIFTSFWHFMLLKLHPKIEFLHFLNRVFDKNRVSCIFSKSSFCGNAQK